MTIKYLFIPVMLLLLLGSCSRQTVGDKNKNSSDLKAELKPLLDSYGAALNASDWDTVLDMMYGKLFEIAPRESIKEVFVQLELDGMKMMFKNFDITSVDGPITADEEDFILIHYVGDIDILLSGDMAGDGSMELLEGGFKEAFGKNSVKMDMENKVFHIRSIKSMFAIAENGTKDWKFLENNQNEKALLDTLIPEKVLKGFGI